MINKRCSGFCNGAVAARGSGRGAGGHPKTGRAVPARAHKPRGSDPSVPVKKRSRRRSAPRAPPAASPFPTRSARVKTVLRHGQDSNLCGETPLDFESNALTTRPP